MMFVSTFSTASSSSSSGNSHYSTPRSGNTHNLQNKTTFLEAIKKNMADDGGLFVPEYFPQVSKTDCEAWSQLTYPDFAFEVLKLFIEEPNLNTWCQNAFNFPLTLKTLSSNQVSLLELFHGPTAAFKDFGARFLSEVLASSYQCTGGQQEGGLTPKKNIILVATSGDTGGAVASAFYQKSGIEVFILFPEKGVSPFQKHQLTCWGDNVHSFGVYGSFDDCQSLVKFALKEENYLSANSINIGRILPQVIYFAWASLQSSLPSNDSLAGNVVSPSKHTLKSNHSLTSKCSFIVPTGNAGNICAALWAKEMGFPIKQVIASTNENTTLWDYYSTGIYTPRASKTTLANAMDVGKPNNFERIRHLFPSHKQFTEALRVVKISDSEIQEMIRKKPWNEIICPHTATAACAYEKIQQEKIQNGGLGSKNKHDEKKTHQQINEEHFILAATAHPAKFQNIIEPLCGSVEIPQTLSQLLKKESHYEILSGNLSEFKELIKTKLQTKEL